MAKFLTTTSISSKLEELIKSAEKEVTLISPYLKVNQRLQNFIRDADMRRVRLTVNTTDKPIWVPTSHIMLTTPYAFVAW